MEWSLTQNKLLAFHRLMRTDKPIGALLLLWPTLWALWVATPGIPPLWILAVFVAGVWLMRAAGCVVNDYADRKFETLHPPAAGRTGRGVRLVDPDGVFGGERVAAAELLADVPRQYPVGGGLRHPVCDGRSR